MPKESSFHTTRASREVLVQKAETVDHCTRTLEDRDVEWAENVAEGIRIEEEDLELGCESTLTTENPTNYFVTCSEIQHIISDETENSTTYCNTPVWAGLVKDKIIDA